MDILVIVLAFLGLLQMMAAFIPPTYSVLFKTPEGLRNNPGTVDDFFRYVYDRNNQWKFCGVRDGKILSVCIYQTMTKFEKFDTTNSFC